MSRYKNLIKTFYRNVTSSIAFIPAALSTAMLLLAIGVLIGEEYGATSFLKQYLNMVVTYSVETARTILSVLIGGVISLTVFSFSMVMILLNQASSYFSPRVLPGLISKRSHQIVLGIYLGTILYCILILINLYRPNNEVPLPGMAIFLAIILGILCMALFVYFIHNISTSIQASNVLYGIYADTRHDLQYLLKSSERQLGEQGEVYPGPELTFPIYAENTGYLQGVSKEGLQEITSKENLVIALQLTPGNFILEGIPVFKTDREVDDRTREDILSCLQFSRMELARKNYVLGFKQLTEIAVKAMSPGINDPGTAMTAIDFLTALFAIRMKLSDTEYLEDEDNAPRVFLRPLKFEELLYDTFAFLRLYCKHDPVMVQKLMEMLIYLNGREKMPEKYTDAIAKEMEALMMDARQGIENKRDLKKLEKLRNEAVAG